MEGPGAAVGRVDAALMKLLEDRESRVSSAAPSFPGGTDGGGTDPRVTVPDSVCADVLGAVLGAVKKESVVDVACESAPALCSGGAEEPPPPVSRDAALQNDRGALPADTSLRRPAPEDERSSGWSRSAEPGGDG